MKTTRHAELDSRTYNKDQSWHHVTVHKMSRFILRAHLTRNAYDTQSGIVIDVLQSDGGWKRFDFLPMTGDLLSYAISYVQQNPDRNAMAADCERALLGAYAILSKLPTTGD